jgi:SAM-dependent methyltransferase
VADLIGAGMPPGAWFDASRQHLSGYVRDHWGMFDATDHDSPAPGQAWALAQAGLALAERSLGAVSGPAVELGAASGGVSAALAAALNVPVLGIDLSAPLARFAAKALRGGSLSYPLRISGTAYTTRTLDVPQARPDTAIWLGDALAPPLPHGFADLVIALNLIDCVADPARLLRQAASLLRPGGRLIACSPCDWSVNATSPSLWVGAREAADAAPDLARWAERCTGLRLIGCEPALPWQVRVHARATMTYQVELFVLQRPIMSS